jgi:hypothetical protein
VDLGSHAVGLVAAFLTGLLVYALAPRLLDFESARRASSSARSAWASSHWSRHPSPCCSWR